MPGEDSSFWSMLGSHQNAEITSCLRSSLFGPTHGFAPKDRHSRQQGSSADFPVSGSGDHDVQRERLRRFSVPLGKLDPSSSKFAKSQRVEGKVTRIYYEYPENRSTLEVFRNYETALKNGGFVTLFTCDSEDTCGYGDVRLTNDRSERWWSQPRQLSA